MFINIVCVLFQFPTFGVAYFCKVIFSLALVAHLSSCRAFWMTAYVISIPTSEHFPCFLLSLFGLTFVFPFPCFPFFPFSAIRLTMSVEGLVDCMTCPPFAHQGSHNGQLFPVQMLASIHNPPHYLSGRISPVTTVSHSLSQTCGKLQHCLPWLLVQFLKCVPC